MIDMEDGNWRSIPAKTDASGDKKPQTIGIQTMIREKFPELK